MYTVNIAKTRGKMAEKGFSCTSLAKEIGITRNTLSNYLSDPNKIPYSVLSKMAEVLCDNLQEAREIFFTT